MKKLFYICAIVLPLIYACNNSDEDFIVNETKVDLVDNGAMLKFKDIETFNSIVLESANSMDRNYVNTEVQTLVSTVQTFKSIKTIFNEAMEEAEDYCDTEEGYYQFKEKYSNLYFPEHDDDYSAYLPVSDENIAKYLNTNGDVMIGEEVRNFKDIYSYQQLVDLGKTPLSGPQLRAMSGINNISEEKDSNGDRKIWVKTYSRSVQDYATIIPVIWIEVCFRKKGAFGIWYNYSSNSTLTANGQIVGMNFFNESMGGASSHDYTYSRIPATNISTGQRVLVPVGGNILISHRGMGNKVLSLTLSYPEVSYN
jgi:hypothetical protein